MTRYLSAAVALVFCTVAAAAANHFNNPAAFVRELHRLSSSGITEPLPAEWWLETPQGVFHISTDARQLSDPSKRKRWLENLAAEIDSYAAVSPDPDPTQVRQRLDSILQDPEFARPSERETWLERLEERFAAWMIRQLDKLVRLAAQHPSTTQVLFWTFLCGAIAFLAWRLFLLWNRPEAVFRLSSAAAAPETRSDDQWIAAAQKAASQGDFGRAIQCAYWAGVVRLQDTGQLAKSSTLTPREYLRTASAPEVAAHLRSLTLSLERFWYAHLPATPENLAGCLGSLEALGCKVT